MLTRSTLKSIEATAKAVEALLTAIDGSPSTGAAAAYRAALVRQGRNLVDTAGPEALPAVLARVRNGASDKAAAEARAAVALAAWSGIMEDRAA